jgi:probable DNA metabolism protein
MKPVPALQGMSTSGHHAPVHPPTWSDNVQVPLSDPVDVAGFHSEATRLLAQQVPPDTVHWSAAPAQSVDEEDLDAGRAAIHNRAARAIIPQSFIRMSELVVLHRDPQRFDLLYRSLWRLVYEPELKKDYGDADLARLRQMAQAVRRDIQKMKAKLVFQPVMLHGESVPLARYEPSHYVGEVVGAWLAKQDPARRWVLLTPDRSLLWNGERLLSAPAVAPMQDPNAPSAEADWSAVLEKLPWV